MIHLDLLTKTFRVATSASAAQSKLKIVHEIIVEVQIKIQASVFFQSSVLLQSLRQSTEVEFADWHQLLHSRFTISGICTQWPLQPDTQ